MFGLHGAQFERLAEAGMDSEQVYILRQILTNPDLELAHSGIMTFSGEIKGGKIRAGKWAKCTRNWSYTGTLPSLGGTHGFVMARECADSEGNRPTGDTLKVILPVAPSQDPNIESGDVIMFFQMPDGSYMAPGYGDNRIGTIMMGVQGDKKARGWGVMNGTNNAKSRGGSGIDAGDKFLRQWTAQSQNKTTGGSATGALDLTVGVTNATTNTGSTTISDAANHQHTLTATTFGTGTSSTVTVATADNTGNPVGDITHETHNHTIPALSHSVTVAASGGGAATAATIPPFLYVAMLERLNNSA